jgi:hypothetical protein
MKLLDGDNILQRKKEENVRHTLERTERMHNIDANGQLIHNQATFLKCFLTRQSISRL